jgi:hypothetical protein
MLPEILNLRVCMSQLLTPIDNSTNCGATYISDSVIVGQPVRRGTDCRPPGWPSQLQQAGTRPVLDSISTPMHRIGVQSVRFCRTTPVTPFT